MAHPPESSTPRSQGLAYPQGQSKLESIPTEILDEIFSYLSHNEVLSFKLPDKHAIHANQSAQKNMHSLCLTSKRVDSVARRLLFQNITITSTPKLILLRRALQAIAQLGCCVRQISFDIMLKDEDLWNLLTSPVSQDGSLLMDGFKWVPSRDRTTISNLYYDHVLSSSYFEVLSRTPQVHHLVLRMQPIGREARREGFSRGNDDIYGPFFHRVQEKLNLARAGHSTKFLPQLTTLQLLGDPKDAGNLFDMELCKPLLQIQTLEKIITFRDNGKWSALVNKTSNTSQTAQALTNAKMADLQQNLCFCHDIRALGILFTNLEVLKISNRFVPTNAGLASLQYDDERSFSDGNGCLQEALLQMKNLHTLEIDLQYKERDRKRPAPMNPSLASLPKLATLKIPLAMLVMEHRRSDRNRLDRLRDVLPKSLKHLTITVEVDCSDHWFWSKYGSTTDPTWPPTSDIGVLVFMETLSKLGHEAFPDLCEVICCYRLNRQDPRLQYGGLTTLYGDFEGKNLVEFSEVDDDYEPLWDDPQRFELLRTSLEQQKWRFTVAYEYTHCSCRLL